MGDDTATWFYMGFGGFSVCRIEALLRGAGWRIAQTLKPCTLKVALNL